MTAPRASTELVARLFPDDIATAEQAGEGDPSTLLPAEALHVRGAVLKRVREFAAGRACARDALARFGIDGFALLAADDRRPIWLEGIVGSITHTEGFSGAAVASRLRFRSVGLDVEINNRVTEELYERVCTQAELSWLSQAPAARRPALAALIFSAKEAFYKCQFPVTGEWLDFHDVALDAEGLDFDEGRFVVVPQRSVQIQAQTRVPLRGRFLFEGRFVMTGMYLPD